jgi:hypothetical protein
MLSSLAVDTDLSRRHHLHTFSWKLRCGWVNIWRKDVPINHLNNVSSNVFQNILCSLADDTDLSRRHHLHTFSQKLMRGQEIIWRNLFHINHLKNVSSNFFQNTSSGLADDTAENHENITLPTVTHTRPRSHFQKWQNLPIVKPLWRFPVRLSQYKSKS